MILEFIWVQRKRLTQAAVSVPTSNCSQLVHNRQVYLNTKRFVGCGIQLLFKSEVRARVLAIYGFTCPPPHSQLARVTLAAMEKVSPTSSAARAYLLPRTTR